MVGATDVAFTVDTITPEGVLKMDISKAKEVFDAAVADVKALAVGSKFLGVMPMAEARGYKRGSQEYGLYISVAVDALPTAIYVDEKTNLITQMSEPNCLTWKGR